MYVLLSLAESQISIWYHFPTAWISLNIFHSTSQFRWPLSELYVTERINLSIQETRGEKLGVSAQPGLHRKNLCRKGKKWLFFFEKDMFIISFVFEIIIISFPPLFSLNIPYIFLCSQIHGLFFINCSYMHKCIYKNFLNSACFMCIMLLVCMFSLNIG